MAGGLSAAATDLIRQLQGVKETFILCYQATLYEIGSTLVYFTPIDTGLASSNWNVGGSGAEYAQRNPVDGMKGQAALEAMSYQVKELTGGEVIYKNPVEYIVDLERGTSPQARGGMINPTSSLVQTIWKTQLSKFNLI